MRDPVGCFDAGGAGEPAELVVGGLVGVAAHAVGGGEDRTGGAVFEVTCPRCSGHLVWRDDRVRRGVLDACTQATGVPASCCGAGAPA